MNEELNIWDRADRIFNDNKKEMINLYENGKMIKMKKIVPCSNLMLHSLKNLKMNTKCKDCGKTVNELLKEKLEE